MGNKYYITGVQLGMLLAFTKEGDMHNEAWELVEEIEDKQWIGVSEKQEKSYKRGKEAIRRLRSRN